MRRMTHSPSQVVGLDVASPVRPVCQHTPGVPHAGLRSMWNLPPLKSHRACLDDAGSAAVITYGSSFGYVATAWANRVPYYVQHLYEDHVYRDPDSIGGKAVPLEGR